MKRQLRLTSPMMVGRDVTNAQSILVTKGLLPVKSVDGKYGPVTANAVKRARYEAGYAMKDVTLVWDERLELVLTGKVQPSVLMRQRAKARRKQPVSQSIGEKTADTMVSWAVADWHEIPAGSNFVPQLSALAHRLGCSSYVSAMRFPWCAMGVFTAALSHDSKAAKSGLVENHWNALYTPTIQQMAIDGRFGLHAVSVKNSITRGTGLLFDFDGGGVDHVGIALGKPGQVVDVDGVKWKPKRSQLVTVEANTSLEGKSGSQSDGGCVAIRIRDTRLVRTAFSIT